MNRHFRRLFDRKLGRSQGGRSGKARLNRCRPGLEGLEVRDLKTATLSFDPVGHVLFIGGTGAKDVARINVDLKGTSTIYDDQVVASNDDGTSQVLRVNLYVGSSRNVAQCTFWGGA